MIDHVEQGDKITADLTNKIIDACNGQLQPAESDFVTTGKGPVFSKGAAGVSIDQTLVAEPLFSCMNAKTFLMEGRPSSPGHLPTYDTEEVKRSWFVKVCSSKDQLTKWLSDTTSEKVLSAMCITGSDSGLDVILDDNQLSSCRNGWFDTASYNSSSLSLKWMRPAQNAKDRLVVAITDRGDADVEGRAEDLTGDKYKVVHSQPICNKTINGLQPVFQLQAQDPYAGWTEVPPPDSKISSMVINDEDFGLSSLQVKMLQYKDDNDEIFETPAASIYKFDDINYTGNLT